MDWFNNNNNLLLKIGFNSTVINNAIILSVEQLQLLPFEKNKLQTRTRKKNLQLTTQIHDKFLQQNVVKCTDDTLMKLL